MRVLLLVTSLSQTSRGGDVYVRGMVNALSGTGVSLSLVAPKSARDTGIIRQSRTDVHWVSDLRGAPRLLRDLLFSWIWTRKFSPDWVIYPHEFAPLGRARKAIILQNIAPFSPSSVDEMGLRGRLIRSLARIRISASDLVVASSNVSLELFFASVGKSAPSALIPPCLDAPRQFDPVKRTVPTPHTPQVLIILGPWRYKNREIIDRAVHIIRRSSPDFFEQVQVQIAGVDKVSESGEVEYLGFLPRSELLKRMQEATLVVFPSSVESLGLPALEAACLGTQPAVLHGTAMAEILGELAVSFKSERELVELLYAVAAGASFSVPYWDIRRLWETTSDENVGNMWREALEAASRL